MLAANKEYVLKFYTPSGTFLRSVSAFRWNSIGMQINAGLGQFSFTLLNQFDDFQEGYVVKLNNRVELTVIDGDTSQDGQVVYSGWISSYAPAIRGSKETVQVSALGYLSKLATSLGRIGSQVSSLVTDGTGISALPVGSAAVATATEAVFKAVVDKYRAAALNPVVNYASGTVTATGTTMSYTFNEAYFQEMLDACQKSAPTAQRWYYYAGADNLLYFGPASSAPVHNFTFVKDFEDISILINGDTIVNNVLFESSNDYVRILRRTSDSTSESLMDDRWKIVKDNSVASTGTADNIANSALAANKDPKRKISVDIVDNNVRDPAKPLQTGYDIERIRPGDTCQFSNFSDLTSLSFGSNVLLIVSVTYSPGMASLVLEEVAENTARDAADALRQTQIFAGYSGLATYGTSSGNPRGYWESGDLKPTMGAVANPGWLFADGSVVLRSDYPDLFTAVGTSCNTGGETGLQFRLPDYRDRVPLGASGGRARGSVGGEESHALTTSELASHTHDIIAWENLAGSPSSHGVAGTFTGSFTPVSIPSNASQGVQATGSGSLHNNIQPYQACNWLVKT